MRSLNAEELAALLYETRTTEEEYEAINGRKKPAWGEVEPFNQDDYYSQAIALLKRVKVGTMEKEKPWSADDNSITHWPQKRK